jgi:hypothetical protein
MKKQIILLCALCAVCIPARSAEEKPAPAQPAETLNGTNGQPPKALARVDAAAQGAEREAQWQAAAAVLRQQRDSNAVLAQDTQMQLQLAQSKIQSLTQELQIAKAKLSAAEKPKTEEPKAATATKDVKAKSPEKPAQ